MMGAMIAARAKFHNHGHKSAGRECGASAQNQATTPRKIKREEAAAMEDY